MFPYWLSGLTLTGLVVPDVVATSTGVIMVTTTPIFFVIYLPLAAAAILASPAPIHRRLRVVDGLLLCALPFV